MIDVRGEDGATGCDFRAHELRRDKVGDSGVPRLAVAWLLLRMTLAAQVLADRNELHLWRDDAGACVGELRDRLAGACTRAHAAPLGIAPCFDPRLPQAGQAACDVDLRRRIGVGARGVIHRNTGLARGRMHGDVAHRHAHVRVNFTGHVDLARSRERVGGYAKWNGSIHRSSSGPNVWGRHERSGKCGWGKKWRDGFVRMRPSARGATCELSLRQH